MNSKLPRVMLTDVCGVQGSDPDDDSPCKVYLSFYSILITIRRFILLLHVPSLSVIFLLFF